MDYQILISRDADHAFILEKMNSSKTGGGIDLGYYEVRAPLFAALPVSFETFDLALTHNPQGFAVDNELYPELPVAVERIKELHRAHPQHVITLNIMDEDQQRRYNKELQTAEDEALRERRRRTIR